jgi:hypothetical protein
MRVRRVPANAVDTAVDGYADQFGCAAMKRAIEQIRFFATPIRTGASKHTTIREAT